MLIKKIAVIGTGNMGGPMAANLAKAGFEVSIFDIVESKMLAIAEHGITVCQNHSQAVSDADLVLTMLPTGIEVGNVFINQLFKHCSSSCLLIDSSTIDINDARQIHQLAIDKGFAMLDAPVSGGTVGAVNGALSFMVGGETESVERAQPAFEALGKAVVHCGKGGMGQAAKMCNNLMLGIQMISVAEGFRLAQEVGLNEQTLFDVATASSGDCFALRTFCPIPNLVETAPSTNNFKPGFSSELMLKDMNLALSAAKTAGIELPLGEDAASQYQTLVETGQAGADFSSVIKLID
ncbi:MAG: 3-hydroxyisobutyrate dehydrogenase [Saprospiraceae bacterium]|jgi:3-hydroxyisobutyrate dehydrogenase